MMKKLFLMFVAVFALSVIGAGVMSDASLVAAGKDDVCQGLSATGGSCTPTAGGVSVEGVIRTGINIFSWIVGIIAVVMVIVGGFQYVTSGGDSGKVTSAKNTIMYALIGLVIVAMAQVIVQFVLTTATTPPPAAPPAAPTTVN
jgi:hypothetical protein